MSKAILELPKMPENCWKCLLQAICTEKQMKYCTVIRCSTDYYDTKRRENCPLKPVNAKEAEREKGCKYCDDNFKFWQAQISGELPNVRFCPMCGKRLKVEYEHKWQREVDGEWKHYYPECQEKDFSKLQQENEQLQAQLDEWKYETKCHIDEVVAREKHIKQLQTQITQMRKAWRKARATINAWDKTTWFECARCKAVRDALTALDMLEEKKDV